MRYVVLVTWANWINKHSFAKINPKNARVSGKCAVTMLFGEKVLTIITDPYSIKYAIDVMMSSYAGAFFHTFTRFRTTVPYDVNKKNTYAITRNDSPYTSGVHQLAYPKYPVARITYPIRRQPSLTPLMIGRSSIPTWYSSHVAK
jgi:hypothetical protein